MLETHKPNNIFTPGNIIAQRYHVLGALGHGGMGMVLKVEDKVLDNELIALKILLPHLADDKTQFARFRNEVLLARRLAHPNIVRLYDLGNAGNGYFFISMEYVAGGSLSQKIYGMRKDRLPFPDIVRILFEIAQGLSAAHKQGVIHRDLKPDNILLGENDQVRVTDFGLARSLFVDKKFTNTGETVGTPYYMAPEQLAGEKVDARVDIYSLGIVAYEMAVGRRPFFSENYLELARMHMSEPLPDFATSDSGIPKWFQDFAQTCAAKKRDDRYQTADEVSEVLWEHVLDAENFTVRRLPAVFSFYVPEKKKTKSRGSMLRKGFLYFAAALGVYFSLSNLLQSSEELSVLWNSSMISLESGLGVPTKLFQTERYEKTNLLAYLREENINALRALLGSEVSLQEPIEGAPMLVWAAREGKQNVTSLLVEAGSELEAVDSSGATALIEAAKSGSKELIDVLLQAGALSNVRDSAGLSPVMYAIQSGNEAVLRALLSKGAGIDAPRTRQNETPLHRAVMSEQVSLVQLLIELKANLSEKDINGNTALHLATKADNEAIIQLLISAGADLSLRNNLGKTPVDLASWKRRESLRGLEEDKNGGLGFTTGSASRMYRQDSRKSAPTLGGASFSK